MDLQRHWEDHEKVTDQMVMDLKEALGVKPYEGLMVVTDEAHRRAFGKPIPDGFVAWFVVDRRLPGMTGYFPDDKNVCYTTPSGEKGVRGRSNMN